MTRSPAQLELPVDVRKPSAFYRRETVGVRRARCMAIFGTLRELYPEAVCELDWRTPFELLVATILSAQSTDRMINKITPPLFERYPDPAAMAGANPTDLQAIIRPSGFFNQKSKSLISCSRDLADHHAGDVPRTMDQLTKLRGVGRKTANVVLGVAFGINIGIAVDTHVKRLKGLLALSSHDMPEDIEQDLMKLVPTDDWRDFSLRVILHGRRVCAARSPDCEHCRIAPLCPSRQTDG